MKTKGKIISWYDKKGFGFITPEEGDKRIFFHINAVTNRNQRPEVNQFVTYLESTDNQGRPLAVNVDFPGDKLTQRKEQKTGGLSIIISISFLIIVGFSVLLVKIPPFVLGFYMVASLFTFIMYAIDKSASKRGAWRTSESTLHLLSLVGGWPGALVAQQKLRHKSKKLSFRLVFWITALINIGTFVWLFTPTGAAKLQSLIKIII
jgi:uncharacterized membrane protein YsdA (DUF1294 family)/cold shock CspA family protein